MNSETRNLEKLGGAVAEALGEGPGEVRRRQQQRALKNYLVERSSRSRGWLAVGAVVAASALLAAVFFWAHPGSEPKHQTRQVKAGRVFSLQTGQQETFQFQGGWVRLEGSSQGEILELGRGQEVLILLERGDVLATIESRDSTEWILEAGPFRVVVVGTVFRVNWEPDSGDFEVRVERGSVRVDGPGLANPDELLSVGEQVQVAARSGIPKAVHASRPRIGLASRVADGIPKRHSAHQSGQVQPIQPTWVADRYQANLDKDVCGTVQSLADYLVAHQVKGDDDSVGWFWIMGADGSRVTSPNLGGLIAMALLTAHEVTHDPRHLDAVRLYAHGMLARWKARSPQRPFMKDIELLTSLSKRLDDAEYMKAAQAIFQSFLNDSPGPKAEVARIERGRGMNVSLLGFDLASIIRASRAVGHDSYAYEAADEILRRTPYWYRLSKDPRYSLISAAALVNALEILDGLHYRPVIDRFRADLLRHQVDHGAFLYNETQVSSYATIALLGSLVDKERQAADKAMRWLRTTMLGSGAFATFNDYMPEPFIGEIVSEVNAEVLEAFAAYCLNP